MFSIDSRCCGEAPSRGWRGRITAEEPDTLGSGAGLCTSVVVCIRVNNGMYRAYEAAHSVPASRGLCLLLTRPA